MPTTFRFAGLLFFASLLLIGQCCQTYIKFGHSRQECAFHMTYNDTACHNFIWSHCSYQDEGSLVNEGSYSTCTKKCCLTDAALAQNWDGIRQCQNNLDQQVIILLSALLGVFLGIPLAISFLFVLYVLYDYICGKICHCCDSLIIFCQQCCCPKPRVGNAQLGVPSVEILQPQVVVLQKGWIRVDPNSQKLRESCCICLQKGISLELECGHVFHRKCIVAWLRKKEACALCRSKELGTVKIYCEKCFSFSRTSTLLDNLDSLNGNKQICSTCQERI